MMISSLLSLSILVAQADAMMVIPPYRPATQAEVLLNSCELAEAIGVVRVEDTYTDFYRDRSSTEEVGAMVDVAECVVVRSLKGLRAGDRFRTQIPSLVRGVEKGALGIMFLARWRGRRSAYDDGQHGPLPHWVIYSGQEVLGAGFETVVGKEKALGIAIEHSTPEGLATYSDIVVSGRIGSIKGTVVVAGQSRPYRGLENYRQLYGKKEKGSLRILEVLPGTAQPGKQQVFYLKRVNAQTFEIIGLHAGAQEIVRGRVGHSGRSIFEVWLRLFFAELRRPK